MSLETEDNGILENNIHQSEHNGLETNGKLSNAMDDVNISTKSPLIDNGNDENSSIKNVSEELQVNSHENSHVIYDFNNIQELVSTNEFSDSSGKNLLRGCKWFVYFLSNHFHLLSSNRPLRFGVTRTALK